MRPAAVLLGLTLLCAPGRSTAQNGAVSEELFQRGVAALKSNDFAQACPALAESQKLDPRPGTLFTLADCEARWGKTASASSRFADYLSQTSALPPALATKHAERRKLAEQKIAELKPLIPRLTLKPPPNTTEVLLDGVPLGLASLGIPLPVDPGEHVAVARVGKGESRRAFSIAASQQLTVELPPPALAASSAPPAASSAPPAASAPPTSASPSTTEPPPAEAPAPRGRSPYVYVAGGVGLAGLAVGSVAGIIALQKSSIVDKECRGTRCSPAGKEAGDAASQAALFSNIGFGVGVVGLAAATFLLLRDPDASAPRAAGWTVSPALSRSAGGVGLARRW